MVYASARRMEAMQSLPAGVHKLLLDVTKEASIKAAVAKVCGPSARGLGGVSEALELRCRGLWWHKMHSLV